MGVPAVSGQADSGLLEFFWLKAALGTVVQRPGELQVGCALGAAVSDVGMTAGGASRGTDSAPRAPRSVPLKVCGLSFLPSMSESVGICTRAVVSSLFPSDLLFQHRVRRQSVKQSH